MPCRSIRGRLDPESGAILERALEASATSAAEGTTYPWRRVDALRRVAELALTGDAPARNADRFQVVVHVDAAALELPPSVVTQYSAMAFEFPRKHHAGSHATPRVWS